MTAGTCMCCGNCHDLVCNPDRTGRYNWCVWCGAHKQGRMTERQAHDGAKEWAWPVYHGRDGVRREKGVPC